MKGIQFVLDSMRVNHFGFQCDLLGMSNTMSAVIHSLGTATELSTLKSKYEVISHGIPEGQLRSCSSLYGVVKH